MTTVGGGNLNTASAIRSTVAGGFTNVASGNESTVGGGQFNVASGHEATIAGGQGHTASGLKSTIAGGGRTDNADATTGNIATDDFATVGGGGNNQAGNDDGDTTNAAGATVSGGRNNTASAVHATVGGGTSNNATAIGSTVGGGFTNTASGLRSAVPGGDRNHAAGEASLAAGRRAKANDNGSFVWGDSTDADVNSTGVNTFTVRASGGVTFYSDAGATTGVNMPAGGGAFSSLSDRNAKENLAEVDGRELLDKLDAIPLATWNYKTQDAAIRHMGPMAQDFHAAFGLGEDNRHISTIDADGVALAGVQAVYRMVQRMVEEKDAQIEQLTGQVRQLQKAVEHLSRAE
jgi:hypothetical protein